MKQGRAVQTLLPSAAAKGLAVALAMLCAAAPAQAATLSSVLDDARTMAVETGSWIQMRALGVWAGDMDAIRDSAFALAGILALLGLWLLVRPPWRMAGETVIALPDKQGVVETASARPVAQHDESEPPPTMRLLEAVAAARAQFTISEAERKRRA